MEDAGSIISKLKVKEEVDMFSDPVSATIALVQNT